MGSKFYTIEEKVKALKLLEMNDYNINKTAKALKIKFDTLKKWQETMGEEVHKPTRLEGIIQKVEDELIEKKEQWTKDIYDVRAEALQRLRQLLPVTTRLDDVTKATKFLLEATNGELSKEQAGSVLPAGQTFFQIVNQQMIVKREQDGIKNTAT